MTDAYTPALASQGDAYTPGLSSDPVEGRPLPPAQPSTMYQPEVDLDLIDREAGYYEASRGLALREIFRDAGSMTDRLFGYIGAADAEARNRQQNRVFGGDVGAPLTAEQANERFGVPGRLTFDGPIDENVASWQQSLAQREAFRDAVVSNADVPWWQALGASLAGSVLDPVALPLWVVPEFATGRFLRSGVAATRLGRLGAIERGVLTGAIEGTAGGVLYEGANLWLHHEARDDYDFGQASANVLFGTVLGGAVGGLGGWWEGRGRPARAPRVVEDLSPDSRMGAFHQAFEAVIEDRPVDVGPVLTGEARTRDLAPARRESAALLDDGADVTPRIQARLYSRDVAVTTAGTEVPVRYALVEADDLMTSHDDDMFANPEFPKDLQPRDRGGRAGSIAHNIKLEGLMNPKRLIRDVAAEGGAPVVDADGLVESGNGRVIALRRNGRKNGDLARRYREEAEAQGYDTTGYENPIVVRVRQSQLTGLERIKLARDLNDAPLEAYSASERAATDAAAMGDDLIARMLNPDVRAAANRPFVKGFLDRVAGGELNALTTKDGELSEAGLARLQAAMVAKAYPDRGLVETLFEATDSEIVAIGNALTTAAPDWAMMRAAIARGEVPAELDLTEPLMAAVNFVRHVRERGKNLAETLELTIGQYDAFAGSAMSPETEVFIRAFFRTKDGVTLWKSPRAADELGGALRMLARETQKATPGPNMFGEVPVATDARALADGLNAWFARKGDNGPPPGLDYSRVPDPTVPAGGDVRTSVDPAGRIIGGPDTGGQAAVAGLGQNPSVTAQEGRATSPSLRAGEETAKPKVPKGEPPPPPRGQPFADPEVATLLADTDAMLLRAGLDPAEVAAATPPAQDPQTVADAVSAAAFCLKGGG